MGEILVTICKNRVLIFLAASIEFYFESETQPEAFPNIIGAFWWAIAKLTTVGYGDVYPVTLLGRFLSGCIAFLGIGLVALPTGIISSGFMEEVASQKMKRMGRSRVKIKKRKKKRRIKA